MEKWMLIPENEGQELNYIEDFRGTSFDARLRAKAMKRGLQRILKQGSIDVKVEKVA